ncbi:MAG TPA: right-handed parallel beta-helix repeat-containing protein [Prosthecobacter sp.]
MTRILLLPACLAFLSLSSLELHAGEMKKATPTDYRKKLAALSPGDTLRLEPGVYMAGLPLTDCNGTPDAWITIEGPAPEAGIAEIHQAAVANCVELRRCSHVALRRLKIQGGGPDGIPGQFGISAQGGLKNSVHHIRIEDCVIADWNTSQQAVGISTKTPTWDWTIRGNTIRNCGTGLYLGNSNGQDPFIRGVIEGNLVMNPLGYCMEIKFQKPRPQVEGIPTTASRTLIRDNVFIKGDAPSPSGDRPNVLVGGFPADGPGSEDLYEICGNFFCHNPRESLLQASGRVSIHDNILVDCPSTSHAAITLRNHDLPLRTAHVYHNTICHAARGIHFAHAAPEAHSVVGNAIFAGAPTVFHSSISRFAGNLIGTIDDARTHLVNPSPQLGLMDLHPLPGKCVEEALQLAPQTADDMNRDRDFDSVSRGRFLFRGAYAGPSAAGAWRPAATLKPRL